MTLRFALILSLGLLGLAGCKTDCEEACQFGADCLTKVNPGSQLTDSQLADCKAECNKAEACGSEDAKQDFLDCVVGMKCADKSGATGEFLACMYKCPNAPIGELMPTSAGPDAGTPAPDAGN